MYHRRRPPEGHDRGPVVANTNKDNNILCRITYTIYLEINQPGLVVLGLFGTILVVHVVARSLRSPASLKANLSGTMYYLDTYLLGYRYLVDFLCVFHPK
jgi:hypothetical protein